MFLGKLTYSQWLLFLNLLLIIPKKKDYIVWILNFIIMYGLGKANDQCKKSNKQYNTWSKSLINICFKYLFVSNKTFLILCEQLFKYLLLKKCSTHKHNCPTFCANNILTRMTTSKKAKLWIGRTNEHWHL